MRDCVRKWRSGFKTGFPLLLLLLPILTSSARTTTYKPIVPILKSAGELSADGNYIFSYESGDGTKREEVGIINNSGTNNEELEITGTYRYISAEGRLIEVEYTAGVKGFISQTKYLN